MLFYYNGPLVTSCHVEGFIKADGSFHSPSLVLSLNKTTQTRQLQLSAPFSIYFFPTTLLHSIRCAGKVIQRTMGNCQAADTTAVVIQYPGGKVERLLWPTSAANVMKSNPGYHVALVTLYIPPDERQDGGGIRITRVKLLKPKEMLLLGQVYRLISSQEVARALRQRQHEKLRKNQTELIRKHQQQKQNGDETQEHSQIRHEVTRQEKDLLKNTQMTMKGRQWRPSLKSISEMPS